MPVTVSGSFYAAKPPGQTIVNPFGIFTQPLRLANPNSKSPVAALASTVASRAGGTSTSSKGPTVGKPTSQSGGAADIASSFTSANQNGGNGGGITDAQRTSNTQAVSSRQNGVLGCIGKTAPTSKPQTPGCNGSCDAVDCLTGLLTGNLLNADAKQLLCGIANDTERSLKHQIDSTGDQLLNAADTLTSLAPLATPLRDLNKFVNGLDPGAVANCLGAQALKSTINGQLSKAKNTLAKFQAGYQDKIAKTFNDATQAAQQFSLTPDLCKSKSPASLAALFG